MKLVSVGIDPDYIGIIADHVSAELYDLQSLIACKWLISLKNIICVWSLIDRRFFECVNQSSAISGAQSFSVRSRFSNESHAARLRGSLTISKCALLLLLFKMNATRDWNRKGHSCGRVLSQLSHEVLVQHCSSSGLRLNDHTSNLFLTIVITLHLFKVIKYYWKARDQRSKSVLLVLPPDTTQNNPTSIIRHLQSCHFLWFFILCATEFQGEHLPCSHVNLSVF